jgi:AcrR family transcriptional regulator
MNERSFSTRLEGDLPLKNRDKREAILAAALELIAEHGFHGAPMAMIAEKAGVAAGTIYLYFENKDVLITELFRELEGKIVAALSEGYAERKSIRERFIYLCMKLLRYFVAHPLHFRFMEQYYNSPYGTSLRRDKILGKSNSRDVFMELFEKGIAKRVLKDLPFYVIASLTFSPLVALARDHTLGLIKLNNSIIRKSIEACWDGIKR